MAWRGSRGVPAAIVALLLVWGSGSAKADGPSFDCAAAKAPIERLICADPALSQADADMAKAYQALRQTLDARGRTDLLQAQRRWLQSRFTDCKIPASGEIPAPDSAARAACLKGLYAARGKDLTDALTAGAAKAANDASSIPAASGNQPAASSSPLAPSANPTGSPASGSAAEKAVAEDTAGGMARLDRTVFPANGRQGTLLNVGTFGRYALITHSAQGTALQLVDRMAGPGAFFGVPGSSDGRLDAFLDRGVYKVVLEASAKGSGEVELDVRSFAELNGPAIPGLPELKLVQGELDDFQQRSYWLDIQERRVVAIEAAGRNLADLRLWRDGNWLVDATPDISAGEPEPGKPLNMRRLVATLEPGLYLLAAYGGPTLPWAKSDGAHPFFLRMGIPTLGEGGRQVHIASPFGVDRYIVPASANYFRLELPEAEAAELSVGDYDEKAPYALGSREGITKKSVPPVATLYNESKTSGQKLVTITRAAGKPYLLQQFKAVADYPFTASGNYWLSTIHSGYGADSIDATAVLTERFPDGPEKVVQAQVPQLDAQARWTRRFNLLGTATAYFHVTQAGSYRIEAAGGKAASKDGAVAEYRFEPMDQNASNYQAPPYRPAGEAWQLEPGYYILTMLPKPDGKGILTVTVRGEAAQPGGPDDPGQVKVTSATWPGIQLDGKAEYILYTNQQPGVEVGVVLRQLPIDLTEDLPVNLKRGQRLDVPVRAPAGDTVTAIGEDGQRANFVVDKGNPLSAWTATDGDHVITLENKGEKPLFVTLHDAPAALAPETPLPAVSADRLAAMPVFPALSDGAPAFFDIAKDEKKTFAVSVQKRGLYRLETTGLLQTEGALRTRTVLALDRQSDNGTGRNFLIQQYLGEGAYQLTVNAQGQTQGHLGLSLAPTALDEGGELSADLPARRSLPAGHGLQYSFTIPAAGHYRLRALGLNRGFTMRLEDADGWPIVTPGTEADIDSDFAPGNYHLVILPQAVDAKVVTLLQRQPVAPVLAGHGPHPLPLNQVTAYQWREPEAGQQRVPDSWQFDLTGAARVSIALPHGLRGQLHAAKSDAAELPEVNGGDVWEGDLPAGSYRLDISSRQPNNRLDYTIDIRTAELIAGQSRAVTAPADIPVSIGSDAVVEIGSFGDQDVRGWLYDDKGNLVATNDDRANDWNFAIAGRLKPGKYRLHVDPVGDAQAATTVSIYQSQEKQEPNLQIGGDTSLGGSFTHLLSLDPPAGSSPAGGGVLLVSANAPGNITGLSLERSDDGGGWQTLGEVTAENPWLAAPLQNKATGHYRLRLWSADRNAAPIALQTRLITPALAKQDDFLSDAGVTLTAVPGITPPVALVAVDLTAPASFQLSHMPDHVQWADDEGGVFREAASDVVFGRGKRLYFAARQDAGDARTVAASRLVPNAAGVALTLPAQDKAALQKDAVTVLDNSAGGNRPVLWLVESRLGQPGIALAREPGSLGASVFGIAAADQSSVAVTLDEKAMPAALRLWNAAQPGRDLPVTLRRFDFAAPKREAMDWAALDRTIGAGQTLALDLPKGSKRLQLALPPRMAVLLQGAGQRDQLIWSGAEGQAVTQDSVVEHLLVLNARNATSHLGISLAPLASADALPALGGGRIIKQYMPTAGTSRLTVTLSDSERQQIQQGLPVSLHVAGSVDRVTLVADDGSVRQGTQMPLSADGIVDIAHGRGLMVAWVESNDKLIGSSEEETPHPIGDAGVIPLAGEARVLSFRVDQPKLLQLKTSTPVIALTPVATAAGRQRDKLQVYPDGANLSLYLAKGMTALQLQAAGPGGLAGVAQVAFTEIQPINEGLGPRQRLAPGESRLFSFTLSDERDIGVGVAGSADIAHCRLLDAAGTEIGSGVVQMHHLKAGTYLLAVDVPSDGTAIEVQPALVGVATPDGSPPDEVKRNYLSLAGLKPKQQE